MTPERCEQIDGAEIWKSGWIFDSSLYFYNSNKIRIFEVKTVLGAAGHMIMLDIRFWLFPEISNFFLSPCPKREQSVHSMAVYRVSPTCLALWTLQNQLRQSLYSWSVKVDYKAMNIIMFRANASKISFSNWGHRSKQWIWGMERLYTNPISLPSSNNLHSWHFPYFYIYSYG